MTKAGKLPPHYTEAPLSIVKVIVNCIGYSGECDELVWLFQCLHVHTFVSIMTQSIGTDH